ncbi:MAG: hypothetical protein FWG40_03260 [Peptococcaceae bacterium]|nr:hypothetical protein [Peptococcaceae bacterium]
MAARPTSETMRHALASPLLDKLVEKETNGLTYKYIYGAEKISVDIIEEGKKKIDVDTFYVHHDRLGSVDSLTSIHQTIRSSAGYDPWGSPKKSDALLTNCRKLDLVTQFTTYTYDPILEIYYAKARMHDPWNKRFLAQDILPGYQEDPQTINRYPYAMSNPRTYTDATGEFPWLIPVIIVAGALILSGCSSEAPEPEKEKHLVVIGSDSASNNNTFINNANTYKEEHPDVEVIIINAWDYETEDKLMSAIIEKSKEVGGLDALVFESHGAAGSPDHLWVSRYRATKSANWEGIEFKEHATIRFSGCIVGGTEGNASQDSLAQHVANKTQRPFSAFVNETTQFGYDSQGKEVGWQDAKSFYQKPIRKKIGEKVVEDYTLFSPQWNSKPHKWKYL